MNDDDDDHGDGNVQVIVLHRIYERCDFFLFFIWTLRYAYKQGMHSTATKTNRANPIDSENICICTPYIHIQPVKTVLHGDYCKNKRCKDFSLHVNGLVCACVCVWVFCEYVFVWFCDSVLLIVKQRAVCWMCKWLMVKRYQRFCFFLIKYIYSRDESLLTRNNSHFERDVVGWVHTWQITDKFCLHNTLRIKLNYSTFCNTPIFLFVTLSLDFSYLNGGWKKKPKRKQFCTHKLQVHIQRAENA